MNSTQRVISMRVDVELSFFDKRFARLARANGG